MQLHNVDKKLPPFAVQLAQAEHVPVHALVEVVVVLAVVVIVVCAFDVVVCAR